MFRYIILSLTGCGKKEAVEKKSKKEIETKPEVSCLDKVNNGDFSCYTGEYVNYFKTSNEVFDNEYFFKLKNERKFEIKENGSICFTNENASLPTSEYQICIYPVGEGAKRVTSAPSFKFLLGYIFSISSTVLVI